MLKKAMVVNNEGEKSNLIVYRAEACGHCSSSSICHKREAQLLSVKNTLDAKPGDLITLEMAQVNYMKNLLMLYVLPLVLFLGGVFGVKALGITKDLYAFLGGALGLLLFFLYGRLTNKKYEDDELVHMVRIEEQPLKEEV